MQKLIFIYNANSGIGNTIIDVAHKIFNPKTYNCNLCAITYNTFYENKTWKTFREDTAIIMEFLHCDAFEKKYKNTNFSYPIILTKGNNSMNILLSTKSINTISSSEALISVLKTKLKLVKNIKAVNRIEI